MNRTKVLVIDDEGRIRGLLVESLQADFFEVRESSEYATALSDIFAFNPDVVLLGLRQPDLAAITICQEVRRQSQVAILVISSLSDEQTKVRALNSGADDYLMEPFGLKELQARIGAVLRRTGRRTNQSVMETGSLRVEIDNHRVLLHGEEIHLTNLEFQTLRLFVTNIGSLLKQETILQRVWGEEHSGELKRLRTVIRQLRFKLGDSSTNPRFIRTEHGVGYRFIQTSQ